jgi:hypothetical protein
MEDTQRVTLFDRESLHDRLMARRRYIVEHIRERGADTLGPEAAAELIEANRVEPIALDINGRWIEDPAERRQRVEDPRYPRTGRMVATVAYTQVIPFTGSAMLLRMRPMRFQGIAPDGEVAEDTIKVTVVVGERASSQDARRKLDEALYNIVKHIEWAQPTIDEYHQWLEAAIPARLAARRAQVAEAAARTDAVGLPVRRTPVPSVPSTRVSRPTTGTVHVAARASPPLRYKIITSLIDFCTAMSRTPETWEAMTEEAIRDTMVAALNPVLPGGILAEGFNGRGKADIIVRSGDVNVLIVELKFWSGPKDFAAALTQLLSYTSWRDTSVAVVPIFRVRGVTKALRKAILAVEALPNYIAPSPEFNDVRMDFQLHAGGDPHKKIAFTVLPVPLVTSARRGKGRPRKRGAAPA